MTENTTNPTNAPANSQPLIPVERFPVCVLGLGLIGGSVLRDLQAAKWPVFGWNRSQETVDAAVADGYDVSGDLKAVLARAEGEDALVVLGVPTFALRDMLTAIDTHAPSVSFTDVTSVKQEVQNLVEQCGMADRFVGSHPMAGTAHSGWSAAMTGLFKGAVWVVTYDYAAAAGGGTGDEVVANADTHSGGEEALPETWLAAFRKVVQLGEAVGAAVIPTESLRHDQAVARISHLPHVLAESLAIVGDRGGALSLALAASSYRDMTRVAGTEPALVRAMLENNRAALLVALDEALTLLTETRKHLADSASDVEALTEAGHAARTRYEARKAHGSHPVIRVRPGAPGWVGQLRSAEQIGAQIAVF